MPFLYDAQHRRARRIFHLDPASHATAAVRKVAAFRVDALMAKLACVREDDRAVAVEMLGESNAVAVREQPFEPAFALFERRRPQVLAVQLDQVEGVEENGGPAWRRSPRPRRPAARRALMQEVFGCRE